ncbi:histidine kinase [Flavobacterium sp. I3-2]|uniref:sensor histidine kinase n=1 Tax=Flavobacterium sp. I3-2 TaxID=2748319 RepID=UPI0015A9C84B|nr:histidine kinase [Flavobacterium sp. I3-2]
MKIKVIIFFVFLSQLIFGQHVDTKVITANNGLFSNNVQKTYIDSSGNLWIGSRAGLSKKNMNSFEIVPEATKYKFNNIFDIIEDQNKNMWIAGYGQGLLFLNHNGSKLINTNTGLVDNFTRFLYEFKDAIYVGTSNGISIISKKDFSVKNPSFQSNSNHKFSITSIFSINDKIYASTINDGIYLIEPDKLTLVSDIKKVFSTFVFEDLLYLGLESKLIVVNPNTFQILKEYPVPSIWEFIVNKNQLYFISSGIYDGDGGFYRLENDKIVNRIPALKIPFLDLKTLSHDKKNELLYIGTQNNGLIQINLNSPVFHQNEFENIYSLCFHDKNEFIFNENGLNIVSDDKLVKQISLNKFKTFQSKNDKKFRKETIIQNHFYPIDYNISSDKIIFYHSEIYNDFIWVASNVGIYKISLTGEILGYYPIHVFHFTFFKNKLITVVPYGGIRIFDSIENMNYQYFHDWKNSNVPAEIVSIAKTENAVYFASALSGLYEYKSGTFKSLLNAKEFLEPKLKAITIGSNGNLIVVTDFNDVYEFEIKTNKLKKVKHISHKKIKGSTTSFVEEIDGVLYVGTNLGINVFDKGRYFFIDKTQGFTNYNSRKAVVNGNKIYVLTTNGCFVLDNSYFKKSDKSNNLATITSIYINNKKLLPSELSQIQNGLSLSNTQNNITLIFTVNGEKYPDKLNFKYRLKSNEPWIDLVNENQINLSYLNRGEYNVELQIFNENTGNTSIQSLVKFTINPPFYLNWYYIIIFSLVIIIITILLVKLRIRIIKNNQEKETALIALKTEKEKKELLFDKQLAEVKLQALKSQMNSHFLFNVLSSIQYYIISNDMDNALYFLERFSSLIRTTLDFSDRKTVTLKQEIDYLAQYIEIENIRVENEIKFILDIDSEINLNLIQIEPLLLQPFIENSIVHAFPPNVVQPKIFIRMVKIENQIKITIEDNGVGYKEKKNQIHTSKGISIVKRRLDLTKMNLNEQISISSSENGTIVILFINL